MNKSRILINVILILSFGSPLLAQMHYNPYEDTINLSPTQPLPPGAQPLPPGPMPMHGPQPSYGPYPSNGSRGVSCATTGCNAADDPYVINTQGRAGMTCATRAGEVAAISCAEMAAAAAVVGAIAILALVFHGESGHSH